MEKQRIAGEREKSLRGRPEERRILRLQVVEEVGLVDEDRAGPVPYFSGQAEEQGGTEAMSHHQEHHPLESQWME